MREKFLRSVLILGFCLPWWPSAAAEEVGVGFIGNITFAFPVYGYPAPTMSFGGSDVTARLVYLTESLGASLGGCDCTGYRQRIFNGFSAAFGEFGEFEVRADEYIIDVTNDAALDDGADLIRIVFESDHFLGIASPLFVNGGAETSGQFFILLRNDAGTAIDDSALPDPSVFGAFEQRWTFLKESPNQGSANLGGTLDLPEQLDLVFGDYDLDDDVDGSDLLIWQRGLGGVGILPADGDRNGTVGASDLTVWEQHFGDIAVNGVPASTPVPEPGALAVAALLLMARSITGFGRGVPSRRW